MIIARHLILFVLISFVTGTAASQVNQFDVTEKGYTGTYHYTGNDKMGNIVVIWQDMRHHEIFEGDERGGAIYGQIYNPDFSPKGTNFRISEPVDEGFATWPNLLVFPDGRFIVTWRVSDYIIMKMYNIDGETILNETVVNDNTQPTHVSQPRLSKIPGDRFLIHWSDGREGQLLRYGQYYESDGTPIGNNVRLNPDDLITNNVQVKILDEERYIIIFIIGRNERKMIRYGINLTPESDIIPLEYYEDEYSGHRRFIFSPDTLLVTYNVFEGNQHYFYFMNLEGEIISEPVAINDDGTIYPKAQIQFSRNENDRSYLFVWEDYRNGSLGRRNYIVADIYAQRFDSSGQPIGSNFKVNHEPREKHQTRPQIIKPQNEYFITWWENRTLQCPPSPTDFYIVNIFEAHIVARTLDVHDPQPGPVFGLEDYFRRCELYAIPRAFELHQNYPNPFNNSTMITFEVHIQMVISVRIEIYDILGRKVAVPVNGRYGKGKYEIPFDASHLSSGVYIMRMTSENIREYENMRRMLLVR